MMFTRLTPSHYSTLLPFFDNQVHRLCYYSLSAFICWDSPVSYPVWTIDKDLLLIGIRHTEDSSKDYLYLPLAKGRLVPPDQLKDLAEKHGFTHFHLVPGEYVAAHDIQVLNQSFQVLEDEDLADYIYKTEDLAELKGKKYSKKRNLINQFLKSHVDQNRVEIHDMTRNDIPECIALLNWWSEDRDVFSSPNPWSVMEHHAAFNAISTIETLGYKGVVLRIDGEVKAFGLGSMLTKNLGGFHFEKADSNIKGLYQYFDRQCVRRLFQGVPFINKECDMGEPGLRQSKRSYYPVDYVRAFELKLI